MLNRDLPPAFRFPLMLLAFVALLAGIGAGLARLGWTVPSGFFALASWHGPLMACGFFGTVIGLERAVALGKGWAYLGPLAGAVGTAALVSGQGAWMPACLVLSSAFLFAASAAICSRQRAMFTYTLALAAGCWVAGNLVFAFDPNIRRVLPWWIAFLALTIAAERLELSRFAPRSVVAERLFALVAGLLVAGCVASVWAVEAGWKLLSASLLSLSLWLARYDLARRTVRQRGLTRFMAVSLLAGYAWLAAGGFLLLATDALSGGAPWDAALHAILLGFVFSMVFGHAPVILPAVLKVRVNYSPVFYVPLALLHASVAARYVSGLLELHEWRPWTAAANASAIAAFIAVMVRGIARHSQTRAEDQWDQPLA